ncbi:hypothetical protein AWR27_15175 [Spirosoma montaniterrae]|uniref:DUF6734 domain-containing protein n=2 Tax=Spirosoma montaniterrae TaxID=1178516 RepID=A0A1P9WYT8_9BACT|nr:hypothetical protein AWR27_15175 [Spirosoma montaniterrae]
MSWALSCLQLRQFYDNVTLITDEAGKTLLIDELGLPYTDVQVVLDDVLAQYPKPLWVVSKLYAYALQQEPFLHVDGDVFLYEPLPTDLLTAPLLAQNEEISDYYLPYLTEMDRAFSFVPPAIRWRQTTLHQPISAANAGILGGNDVAFLRVYAEAAFDFIEQNRAYFSTPQPQLNNFNILFEQYLFSSMAAYHNVPVRYVQSPNFQLERPCFEDAPRFQTYLHPIAPEKKVYQTCQHVARRLQLDYPDYYRRISTLSNRRFVSPAQSPLYPLFASSPAPSAPPISWTLNGQRYLQQLIPVLPDASPLPDLPDVAALQASDQATYIDEREHYRQHMAAQTNPPDAVTLDRRADACLRADLTDFDRQRFVLSDDILVIDCQWNWALPIELVFLPDAFDEHVSHQARHLLEAEPKSVKICIEPDWDTRMLVETPYEDIVDVATLEVFNEPHTVAEAFGQLRAFFGPDFPEYESKITKRFRRLVRQLVARRCLVPVEHTATP